MGKAAGLSLLHSPPWAERHPDAAVLDGAVPGVGLVAYLDSLEPADVDHPTLLEIVAGWDRIASWAAARQALAVAEMTRRAPGSEVEFVADEIGARLGSSRRAAQDVVDLATGLDAFPAVHGALGRGEVDLRKARLLLTETDHLPGSAAEVLHDAVLAEAPRLSAPQLRLALRRAESSLDPRSAAVRTERARRDRCVRMVPAPDAMAWIHALLPAPDALTVVTAVDALAAAAAPQDERTADQRRADALTDLCRRVLDAGVGPDGTALPIRQHRRPHLQLTVSAATIAAYERGVDGVADLAGYGPVPVAAVADLIDDAAWRPVLTDEQTGMVLAVGNRTYRRRDSTPVAERSASNSLATRSSATYRPGTDLAALVTTRDVTCTFPGCRLAAERCDLDHIEPFDPSRPAEQQTTETNLHPLCRHHHRLKTVGRWRVERDPVTAVTTWHGPGGRTYTRDPVPADPTRWDIPRRRARPTWGRDDAMPAAARDLVDRPHVDAPLDQDPPEAPQQDQPWPF